MKLLVRSPVFWGLWVTPVLIYVIITKIFPSRVLLESLAGLGWVMAIAISIAFTPAMWKIARNADPKLVPIRFLAMGVWLTWTGTALDRLWATLWYLAGRPPWMYDNDLIVFIKWTILIGGACHLLSPNALWERLPGLRWIVLGCCISLGITTSFFLMTAGVDLSDMMEAVRPYIMD